MKALLDWLDRRTGYRRIIEYSLYENIPGGARWRYVWGSTLVFCLSVQFFTGLCLWMAYSPSSQTAWESVYYIQDEMSGGWLLRGLHPRLFTLFASGETAYTTFFARTELARIVPLATLTCNHVNVYPNLLPRRLLDQGPRPCLGGRQTRKAVSLHLGHTEK